MKKVVSLVLISLVIFAFSTTVFATDSVLGDGATTITGNEYESAQKNTQNNDTTLPQTGVENFGLGILLVVCAGSAIFAYKKVSDYRGI